jgi:hypothetical protein
MFYFQVINNGYLFCFQAINLSLSVKYVKGYMLCFGSDNVL